MTKMNKELSKLIEEERRATDLEQQRLEQVVESVESNSKRMQQKIKNKLFLLHSTLAVGNEIHSKRDEVSVEELFDGIQQLAHRMQKQIALTSLTRPGPQY